MQKRIALVTGGNRGIALETCRQLARLGFTVLLKARDPDKGNMAVNKLVNKEGWDVIFYLLDVTNTDHITAISKQVEQQYGSLNVLINNAAIHYNTWQRAIDTDLEVVNQAMVTNVFGPWRLCQAFIHIIRRNRYVCLFLDKEIFVVDVRHEFSAYFKKS
jgi:NAD(P)-dependent dehydrogenase (short-subunit alcohol dehydrogenase family)